jgi:hypothetical protein
MLTAGENDSPAEGIPAVLIDQADLQQHIASALARSDPGLLSKNDPGGL